MAGCRNNAVASGSLFYLFVSYLERKAAVDYFLSVRRVQKENYLAYLYLDTKGQLFLMRENADTALMQVADVNERMDLVEAFSGLITRKLNENTPAPVDFILGAENDTPMRSVSLVKDAVREVYGRSCGGVTKEKNVSLKEVEEGFPLSITFTSLQANDPEGIVQQVRTTTRKHDTEEMAFLEDNALVIVDEKMDQSDVGGIQKMLSKEDKLATKKTCFVLGTGF